MTFCVLVPFVKSPRIQDLTEASDSIISMMLRVIRVHGLGCLDGVVTSWLICWEIGRILKQFRALLEAHKAGTLVLPGRGPGFPPHPRQAAAARPAATARRRR